MPEVTLPDISMPDLGGMPFIPIGVFLGFVLVMFLAFAWRRVVDTNMVHIVQSGKKTISYGAGQAAGNVYYDIPHSIPLFGISVIKLPVSNFELAVTGYPAFDKDKAEFNVDIVAFFRISDTNLAASRISSFEHLKTQLTAIVQGAARKVLAMHDIQTIMTERATFGKSFTEEVRAELKQWGVEPVKSLELMDIRDAKGSVTIQNIMAMKAAEIERLSRVSIAENKKQAENAETAAQQEIALRKAEAEQVVGERNAQVVQSVGIADEKAKQTVQQEAALTMTRVMEVQSVEVQRKAEIAKNAGITKAEEDKERQRLAAEAKLIEEQRLADAVKIKAAADAEAIRLNGKATAEATQLNGSAEAEALRLNEMAKVTPQIELATAIGENQNYQTYLITVEQIKAGATVGVAQASAMEKADIKVIATGGSASSGIASVGELISSAGGAKVTGLLESLAAMPEGRAILNRITGTEEPLAAPVTTPKVSPAAANPVKPASQKPNGAAR